MKPLVIMLLLFCTLLNSPVGAQEQQVVVPFTLADRDRGIRTEAKMEAIDAKMEALETKMDVKFEAVNERIDYIFWLQGVVVAMILFMLGYTIWDRRTALQPALDKAFDSDAKSTNLIQILREYAKNHPDLAEILRSHGIL